MKTKSLVSLFVVGTLVLGLAGCKKEEPAAPKTVEEVKPAAEKAAEAVKDTAQKAATEVKEVTEKAAAEVKKEAEAAKEAAPAVTAPASDKADGIIEKAKALVGESKYQEALSTLNELTGVTLSEAQQKVVDALKEQIQKAIADKAAAQGAGAVGNLLGK